MYFLINNLPLLFWRYKFGFWLVRHGGEQQQEPWVALHEGASGQKCVYQPINQVGGIYWHIDILISSLFDGLSNLTMNFVFMFLLDQIYLKYIKHWFKITE